MSNQSIDQSINQSAAPMDREIDRTYLSENDCCEQTDDEEGSHPGSELLQKLGPVHSIRAFQNTHTDDCSGNALTRRCRQTVSVKTNHQIEGFSPIQFQSLHLSIKSHVQSTFQQLAVTAAPMAGTSVSVILFHPRACTVIPQLGSVESVFLL